MKQRYEYDVYDVTVPQGHGTQRELKDETYKLINELAKKGWRLHTYQITGFGRVPGFLGVTFENVCHLVFERPIGPE